MKKHFRITVNGKEFDVVAETVDLPGKSAESRPSTVPIPSAVRTETAAAKPAAAPQSAPAPVAAGAGDVVSPLSGTVVSIDTPVGTAVKVGDRVVTLEAMKMNTVVTSTADGTVKSVSVSVGDGVEEGQVLLSIG